MEYERPNNKNVELGDLLLANQGSKLIAIPITRIDRDLVVACFSSEDRAFRRKYERAIILKQNGSYLVGEEITREAEEKPFIPYHHPDMGKMFL